MERSKGLKKLDPTLGQIVAMFESLWSHPGLTLLGGEESPWAGSPCARPKSKR
jgi:hypothetical protein